MFFNRDLSWLGFNYRVLQEAEDKRIPLYERLKFLAIFSSNLDEFFRVRYPVIIALTKLNPSASLKAIGMYGREVAEQVQHQIGEQLEQFGKILQKEIIPDLNKECIFFYYNVPIKPEHLREVREICLSQVFSFIQPIMLDVTKRTDFLPENNQLYLVVTLNDSTSGVKRHTILNIPSKKLKRFYILSRQNGMDYIIFIDDILRENLPMLFPGLEIESVYSVKFNRDAELDLDGEYNDDILYKIEKKLKKRDKGPASRFLYERGMPGNLRLFIASLFDVELEDMFEGGRYHNLSDLAHFPDLRKNLYFEKWIPASFPPMDEGMNIFNTIYKKDILLHLPYHSYSPVLSFFNQAAIDTDVTHIYITLYRVAAESHIVNALISAARNGKKVIAFIELKARFDEANNIEWSRMMKKAGVKLFYSSPKIKVHSKIALIKKKHGKDSLAYALLSTGNFNETTAQFYTDHVLMTCNLKIIRELMLLFEFLQDKDPEITHTKIKFKELLVSQFNMVNQFEGLINEEIRRARSGSSGLIRIKVNNLEEPYMISLLYKASMAGVKIELIIRSVCCIIPSQFGTSENITVRRLVDRYLEHTRIFIFGEDEDAVVIMGSADLMTRNLLHRIEVCVPVKDADCRKQLITYFKLQWSDNTKAVELLPDHTMVLAGNQEDKAVNAQETIYHYLQNSL